MIQNIMETDTGEALSYLNFQLVVFFILGVVMPVALIWKVYSKVKLRQRLWSMARVNNEWTVFFCHIPETITQIKLKFHKRIEKKLIRMI